MVVYLRAYELSPLRRRFLDCVELSSVCEFVLSESSFTGSEPDFVSGRASRAPRMWRHSDNLALAGHGSRLLYPRRAMSCHSCAPSPTAQLTMQQKVGVAPVNSSSRFAMKYTFRESSTTRPAPCCTMLEELAPVSQFRPTSPTARTRRLARRHHRSLGGRAGARRLHPHRARVRAGRSPHNRDSPRRSGPRPTSATRLPRRTGLDGRLSMASGTSLWAVT